jgi:protein-disulfide isomerase
LLSFRGLPAGLRWLMRLGALGSLFYLGVMVWEGHLCPYCLAVHGANLLAWLCAEWLPASSPETGSPRRTLAVAGAVFALLIVGLSIVEQTQEKAIAARSAEQMAQSIEQIVKPGTSSGSAQPSASPSEPTAPGADSQQQPMVPEEPTVPAPTQPRAEQVPEPPIVEPLPPAGFTGRFRRGPEAASVRLVVWADYECEDCQVLEKLLSAVVRGRDDVSLSLKNFPFCNDCNPKATYNRHPNACRAAQAVEAAGVLGGEKAYWGMADWMLEHGAAADEAAVLEQAAKLGLDREKFRQAQTGPAVAQRIAADIDEAMRYGLDRTPFIFINGVELRGWRNPQQVEQAVLAVAAKNLPAKTAEADRPRPGAEKYLQLWRNAQAAQIPALYQGWPLGKAGEGPRIVWFGEHESQQSAAASDLLLAALKKHPEARLEFRHYPLSKRGNPLRSDVKVDAYPRSYDMGLLAQAAGRVGGRQGFWKMHRWLIEHRDEFDPRAHLRAAADLGLDPKALERELTNPETAAAIEQDLSVAARLGVRQAPTVAIDGRPVDGLVSNPDVVERILDELSSAK